MEYLLIQTRHLTGEERSAKTREEVREASGGLVLLTDLCLAMMTDPLGMIRGLGEVLTCVGEVVTSGVNCNAGWGESKKVPSKPTRNSRT